LQSNGDRIGKQSTSRKKTIFNKKLIAIILVAIVAIATAASAAAILTTGNKTPNNQINNNQTNNQNSITDNQNIPQSWIKKGAYATYAGQAEILSMSITFNARMEIVDVNQTHMQLSTEYNMSTPFGATENTTTTWVSREDMNFQPEDLTLNNTYTTQITIPNLGTRTCTVYEYSSQGISAAYYVDNSIQWPIKMVMTSPTVQGQSYNMDIKLVDTNIPGL
jgi:archaellin